MIGDSVKDVQAGRRAGCRTAQLMEERKANKSEADVAAPSLLAVVHRILEFETVPIEASRVREEKGCLDVGSRYQSAKQ